MRKRTVASADEPKPTGSATDAVDAVDKAIEGDKTKRKLAAKRSKGKRRSKIRITELA